MSKYMYVTYYECMGVIFCFKAEDGIQDLVRSRGLGEVYKRRVWMLPVAPDAEMPPVEPISRVPPLLSVNDPSPEILSLIHI